MQFRFSNATRRFFFILGRVPCHDRERNQRFQHILPRYDFSDFWRCVPEETHYNTSENTELHRANVHLFRFFFVAFLKKRTTTLLRPPSYTESSFLSFLLLFRCVPEETSYSPSQTTDLRSMNVCFASFFAAFLKKRTSQRSTCWLGNVI